LVRLLFLAVAAFLALAPGAASAHRGVDHAADAAFIGVQQPGETAAPAAAPDGRAWSIQCPGGAGSNCCCENLDACSGTSKTPALAGSGWRVVPTAAAAGLQSLSARSAPRSLLALSPALPRAPPLFS
jgi:hypothetical protein